MGGFQIKTCKANHNWINFFEDYAKPLSSSKHVHQFFFFFDKKDVYSNINKLKSIVELKLKPIVE